MTAQQIAAANGHQRLVELFEPQIEHRLLSEAIDKLETQLHDLMYERAGDKVCQSNIRRVYGI
jgi:hypothetical protein